MENLKELAKEILGKGSKIHGEIVFPEDYVISKMLEFAKQMCEKQKQECYSNAELSDNNTESKKEYHIEGDNTYYESFTICILPDSILKAKNVSDDK